MSTAGGTATSFSIQPILPVVGGLRMDSTTGKIFGTPVTLSFAATYAITATNSGGSSVAYAINISVVDRVPIISSYTNATAVYTINAPIYNNTPTMSTAGGTPTTFSINPGIPPALGLRWDSVR
jgi:hypothetical protein